jgi:hypothetical protein
LLEIILGRIFYSPILLPRKKRDKRKKYIKKENRENKEGFSLKDTVGL